MSKKTLIIVESPTKARTLLRFLGDEYKIEATYGHLRDLPKKRIGVDTERNFAPTYVVAKDRKNRVDELKKEAKESEKVMLATDPDREGEAIAWHVMALLRQDQRSKTPIGHPDQKYERIVFHEITERAIKEALLRPREIDMKLVDSQQARRILDRLVGYKLSPLLWNKIRKGLSAGRVQSVAVRLVVEREREIKAFIAQEYWEVEAELQCQMSNVKCQNCKCDFKAKLVQIKGHRAELKNKEEADKIVRELTGAEYKVKNIETKEVRKWPYPPFSTSGMQQAAGNRYGWSAKKTMQMAQQLYEEGFITYMRTDSFNLSAEAIQQSREYITKTFGDQYAPMEPKYYKTKSKVAQEAHEAIRPTNIYRETEEVEGTMGRDAARLYDLIRKRMLACQMNEAVYDQKTVEVIAVPPRGSQIAAHALSVTPEESLSPVATLEESYLFRVVGSKIKFEGWKKVYTDEENGSGMEELDIPDLTIGEILKLLNLIPSQHFTEPPSRYTEASLIKTMEEKGIGRPSTYAPTMSTIQDRQYVEKEERKLVPTELGFAVNDFLVAQFPEIIDYGFTAQMEDGLDDVANGEREWQPLISEFYRPFEEKLKGVYETAERVKIEVETTDEKCEKCGSPMVVRIGKFGRFLACSTFPKCDYTKNLLKTVGVTCSKCGGDVIQRKTRRGKTFYGCSNYPKCDFASWTKPVPVRVPAKPKAEEKK